MVGLQTLLSIDGVVTTGTVRTVHPDLREEHMLAHSWFQKNEGSTINQFSDFHLPLQDANRPVVPWSLDLR